MTLNSAILGIFQELYVFSGNKINMIFFIELNLGEGAGKETNLNYFFVGRVHLFYSSIYIIYSGGGFSNPSHPTLPNFASTHTQYIITDTAKTYSIFFNNVQEFAGREGGNSPS